MTDGTAGALMSWLLVAPFAVLAIPVAVFCVQVMAARMAPSRPMESADRGTASVTASALDRPRLAVLVPAHNEEAGLAATLANIRLQLRSQDRLLVVADNCADGTADIAARCGAEVVERSHATLRGKGYALDFGLQHLAADAPTILVIVDADCTLAPQALDHLAHACLQTGRPVQGLYLMNAPAAASLRQRVAAFAWRVKNWVRPLGALRLGGPCPLMGTGMAFPWPLITRMSLANGHLVEDMKLGIDLAGVGAPPLFVPEARIDSVFPTTLESAQSQRARWEHGHIATLLAEGPGLLARALRRGEGQLAAMALDLLVPPLTLLLGLVVLSLVAAAILWTLGWSAPLGWAGASLAALIAALVRAWWLVGRPLLSARDLLRAPAYALWKVPIYLKFVTQRQKEWVRTDRHDE